MRPIVPWFYNPNVQPAEEHHRRRDAFAFLAARLPALAGGQGLEVDFSAPYEPKVFLAAAARSPDPPDRCRACYRLRSSKIITCEKLDFGPIFAWQIFVK
jgi:predicted adenine nucleotide alpha hydrolase (AANH) superfamily ATPase